MTQSSDTSRLETMNTKHPEAQWAVAALYKFVTLQHLEPIQKEVRALCDANGILGTILVAHEGVNGTVSGSPEGIDAFVAGLRHMAPFSDLDVKFSHAFAPPFHRMKVRLKKEIVTLGVDGVDAANDRGTYVEPEDWNALISQENVVVVDTRNDYEVAIGTFDGAMNPDTASFRDLPDWVDEELDMPKDTPVAMFCTGGIRCEKSTALLKAKGFTNVHHLKGGILKYLETVPEEESLWQGECFVFDQRVSVRHGLEVGDYDMCHACRRPITEADKEGEAYKPGISCPHCVDEMSDEQRARFAERQKQMELAKARDETHLAANVQAAKDAKRAEKNLQRAMSKAARK